MPRAPAAARPSSTPPGIAPLDEAAIRAQTDPGSFERGTSYYRSGRIFDAIRRGRALRARCHGSSGGPYLVEATLAPADRDGQPAENPISIGCTCPRGGFCKHIVALLLTWVYAPQSFEERPPVVELLSNKSREELVALVELLLAEAPDLEDLVSLPMPIAVAAAAADDAPVDEAAIRRQIDAAIDLDHHASRSDRWGYDPYGDEYGSPIDAAKLDRLAALGEAYADAGRWRNALSVCATLIERLTPEFDETLLDVGGEFAAVLMTCDRVLAAALDAQGGLPDERRLSPDERERLLDALFDLWEADAAAGGHDLAREGPAAIARSATPEEQRRLGQRVRETIRPSANPYDGRARVNRAAIAFLSRLAGDAGLSDEELLAEYKGAELWEEAAETLLRTGRVEEAIALAARRLGATPVLLRFAGRLVATGEPHRIEQATALVDGRLWEHEGRNAHDDQLLLEWLQHRYAEQDQPGKSLDAARRRFKLAPGKATYDAVRSAAALPGHADDPWPALRSEMRTTLRGRGDWVALIDAHLDEGEVGASVEIVKERAEQRKPSNSTLYGWGSHWTSIGDGPEARVARAAERDYPDDAIAIYLRLAERQIEARQRPAYCEAAACLARVKEILAATGRTAEWHRLITDLRQREKRLRALREELDALDLR